MKHRMILMMMLEMVTNDQNETKSTDNSHFNT
jgi:hypothetical protein